MSHFVSQGEPNPTIGRVRAGQYQRDRAAVNAQSIDVAAQWRQCHVNREMLLDQSSDVTERVTAQIELTARQFCKLTSVPLRLCSRSGARPEAGTSLLNNPMSLRARPSRWHTRH